jgi:hypothetical protein
MDNRRFTDEQLISACDMHIDNLRQLITWRAAVPHQRGGGRGRVRLWTMQAVHRISITSSLFHAGFSLRMAHTLAYLLPLDDLLSLFYDPQARDLNRGDQFRWFEPTRPRVQPEEDDWYLHVVNGRFVYLQIGTGPEGVPEPIAYGELNRERTLFKSQIDFAHYKGPIAADPANVVDSKYLTEKVPKWERYWTNTPEVDPSSLSWEYDGNFNEVLAKDLFYRHKSKNSVNLSLGLKIAVRMALNLPVDYS